MQHPRDLTDRTALARNRRRARAAGDQGRFLQDRVADDVQERLALVNRRFTAPAVVTGWPEVWRDRLHGAKIVADDDTLALEPGGHDLLVHALALHWANDPVGQLVQARRALRPDGLFIGVLFGGQTLTELRAVLAESEAAVSGGLSPRVLPTADIRDLGGLLQRAGFALPVADSLKHTVSYPDALALMRDLRAMGEANAMSARTRQSTTRRLFAEATARYARSYVGANGQILATFETIFLAGWAPDGSQPRPLRPGSAEARLADVLGATESPLPRDAEHGD